MREDDLRFSSDTQQLNRKHQRVMNNPGQVTLHAQNDPNFATIINRTQPTPPQNQYSYEENGALSTPSQNARNQVAQPDSITPTRLGDEDVESMLLKMQNKMKCLESRYLDLANFYKQELLQGSSSRPSGVFLKHQLGGDVSLYSQKPIVQSKSPMRRSEIFDQRQENILISELLKEKQELESELQDMIKCAVNPNDESGINVEGRLTNNFGLSSSIHVQSLNQENQRINQKFSELLDQFQEQFIEFINQHYQSFTEHDVLDLFQDLRQKIADLIQNQAFGQSRCNHHSNFSNAQQNELQESLKSAIAEYELSNGYVNQAIKKTAFEIQSKHGVIHLDSRKAQIALQSISKRFQQLSDNLNSQSLTNSYHYNSASIERSPNHQNAASIHQGVRVNSQTRGSVAIMTNNNPLMSPNSQQSSNQHRLIHEIQSQVTVLSQSLFQISDKLTACDDDLRYLLNDVEEDQVAHIDKLKSSIDEIMAELRIKQSDFTISINQQREEAQDYNSSLQSMSQQLQKELQKAKAEIGKLKLENFQLQRDTGVNAHNSVSIQQSDVLQQKLLKLQTENAKLHIQIRSLTKDLDEKSNQAERLASELNANVSNHSPSAERSRSREKVSLDQILFYQKKYDDSLKQTKELAKLTQRFLTTMKKLQKAVHRKEPNVSAEKQDFEEARKDLEIRLREIKQEVLAMSHNNDQISIKDIKEQFNSNTLSDNGQPAPNLIHRYQNKAPQTLTGRNTNSQPNRQRTQAHPYMNQQQVTFQGRRQSADINQQPRESQNSRHTSNSKSPKQLIPVSRDHHRVKPNSRNNLQQQHKHFYSIEATSNTRNLLLNVPNEAQQVPSEQSSQRYKREDAMSAALRQRIRVLEGERDSLRELLETIQQDKDQLSLDLEDAQRKLHELTLEHETLRLQQTEALERIIEEQRNTIEVLEDNARIAQENIETIRNGLREDLEGRVKEGIKQMEVGMQELEMRVGQREQELSKLRRQLERCQKEVEQWKQQINVSNHSSNHQQQLDAKEQELQSALEQLQQANENLENYQNQCYDALTQLQNLKNQHETHLQQLQKNYQDCLTQLQLQAHEEIESQKAGLIASQEKAIQEKEIEFQFEWEEKENQFNQKLLKAQHAFTQMQNEALLYKSQVEELSSQLKEVMEANEDFSAANEYLDNERKQLLQRLELSQNELTQAQQLIASSGESDLALKEQAQKDLLAAQSLAELRQNTINVLEEQVQTLSHQMNRFKEEHAQLKSNHDQILANYHEAQDQHQKQTLVCQKLQSENSGLQTSRGEVQKELEETIEAYRQLETQFEQQVEQLEELQKNYQKNVDQLQSLKDEHNQTSQDKQKLESHVEWLQNQITTYLSQIETLNTQAERVKSTSEQLRDQKFNDLTTQTQKKDQLIAQLNEQIDELTQSIENLQTQFDEIQERLYESDQQNIELRQSVEQLEQERDIAIDQAEKIDQQLKEQANAHSEALQELQSKCHALQAQASQSDVQIANQLHSKDTEISSLKKQSENLLDRAQDLQDEVTRLESVKVTYETRVQLLESQMEELQGKLAILQTSNQGLDAQINELKQSNSNIQSDKDTLQASNEANLLQIQQLSQTLEQYQETLQQNTQVIENQQLALKQDGQIKSELEQAIQELQQANDEFDQELNRVNQLNSDLQAKIDAMQLQAQQQINEVTSEHAQEIETIKSLMEEKYNHRIEELLQQHTLQIQALEEKHQQTLVDLEAKHTQALQALRDEQQAQIKQQCDELGEEHERELSTIVGQSLQLKEDLLNQHQDQMKSIQEEHQKEVLLKVEVITNLEKDIDVKSQQIEDLKEQIQDLTSTIAIQSQQIERLNAQVDTHSETQSEELHKLSERLRALSSDLEEKERVIETLKIQISDQIQQSEKTLEEKDRIITQLKSEREVLQQTSQQQKEKIENIESELTELKEFHNQNQDQLQSLSDQLAQSQASEQDTTDKYELRLKDLGSKFQEEVLKRTQHIQSQLEDALQQLHFKDSTLAERDEEVENLTIQRQDSSLKHERELGAKTAQIAQMQAQLESKNAEIQKLHIDRDSMLENMKPLESDESPRLLQQIETLKEQINQLESQLGQIQGENQALKDEHAQELQARDQLLSELEERARLAEQAFEQQESELQQALDERQEAIQMLGQNKDLIQLLRDELSKSIDKQKAMKAESEAKEQEIQQLHTQVDELHQQIARLREEAANMATKQPLLNDSNLQQDLSKEEEIAQMKQELQDRDDLIEDANRCIEEFNEQKHEIKAKFKHLMHLLEDPSIQPEEESEYRGEDDQIELNECFERLEKEIIDYKRNQEAKITQIDQQLAHMKTELLGKDEEIGGLVGEMERLATEMEQARVQFEENDEEMRRQMGNAQRKIEKYRAKLLEMQQKVTDEDEMVGGGAPSSAQIPEPSITEQIHRQEVAQENAVLLQRLQQAELELQQHRNAQKLAAQQQQNSAFKQAESEGSSLIIPDDIIQQQHLPLHSSQGDFSDRLAALETQLMTLRRQLFEAKDQVLDSITEALGKRLRELQNAYRNENLLRAKLSELKTQQSLELTLVNSNIKAIKYMTFISPQGSELRALKRLIVVQVMSNNECYVIDEAKMSDTAREYLQAFLPEYESYKQNTNEESGNADGNGNIVEQITLNAPQDDRYVQRVIQEMNKLEEQVKEIREERLEVMQELAMFKSKVANGQYFADLKDLELEDENAQLTAENIELRGKLKDLSLLNRNQQLRILELNELLREAASSGLDERGEPRTIQKLKEENLTLRRQLSEKVTSPKMISNLNKFANDDEDGDIDHNSFLQGIEVAENIVKSHHNLNTADKFDQSSLMLNQVIEDLDKPASNSTQQHMEKLTRENEELRQKLLQSMNNASQQSGVLNSGESGHIKATLLQFLRSCPLTERNNEQLLNIVMNMMEFSKDEITELQEARQTNPRAIGPPSAGKPGAAGRANSVSSGGHYGVGGTDPGEDEIKKKTSKGIFGMFGRKGSSQRRDGNSNDISSQNITSPGKAMMPIGRR